MGRSRWCCQVGCWPSAAGAAAVAAVRARLVRVRLAEPGRGGDVFELTCWSVAVLVLFTAIADCYPARGDETSGLLFVGEPGHERPELGADLLDLLVVLFLATLEEVRLARVELL